jgi:hypothetical protein
MVHNDLIRWAERGHGRLNLNDDCILSEIEYTYSMSIGQGHLYEGHNRFKCMATSALYIHHHIYTSSPPSVMRSSVLLASVLPTRSFSDSLLQSSSRIPF